jgi:hypothetical protein
MSSHVLSANGALLSPACGSAPGITWPKKTLALKARVINVMSRAFSARPYFQFIILGRCPRFATANPSVGGLGLKSALSALDAHGKGEANVALII